MDDDLKIVLIIDDNKTRREGLLNVLSNIYMVHIFNFRTEKVEVDSVTESGMAEEVNPPVKNYPIILIHARNYGVLNQFKGATMIIWYGGYGAEDDLDIPNDALSIKRKITSNTGWLTLDEVKVLDTFAQNPNLLPGFLRTLNIKDINRNLRKEFMLKNLQDPKSYSDWSGIPSCYQEEYKKVWIAFSNEVLELIKENGQIEPLDRNYLRLLVEFIEKTDC